MRGSVIIKDALRRFGGAQAFTEIKSLAYSQFGNSSDSILDLSFESGASVLSLVKDILEFDAEKIFKAKKGIKNSISKSAKIRKKIDECNIDSVQVYMQRKNILLQTKTQLLTQQIELSEVVA